MQIDITIISKDDFLILGRQMVTEKSSLEPWKFRVVQQ